MSKKLKISTYFMVYHLQSKEYDSIFAISLLKSFCLCHFVSEIYFSELLLLSTGAIMTPNHGIFVKVSTFFEEEVLCSHQERDQIIIFLFYVLIYKSHDVEHFNILITV